MAIINKANGHVTE